MAADSTEGPFAWETLHVILEGRSPLELDAMAIEDRAQAHAFLLPYGFDVSDEKDRKEVSRIHQEAVAFIRRFFLHGKGARRLEMPREVQQVDDVADLLVMASEAGRPPLARWACALLRVMHTIHHANRALRKDSFDEIRRQVFDPFRKCLQVDELGCPILVKDKHRVQLEGVFFKEDKSRDSIILKLLHKPNNVAQDIYDWLGVQLVTRTSIEALLAVRFLRMHNLVTFANIVPGRSINNLIDLDSFRASFEGLAAEYKAAEDAHELWVLEHMTHELRDFPKLASTLQNPFSGPEYRSIQFTCRQLIKVPNPAHQTLQALRRFTQHHPDDPELNGIRAQLEKAGVKQDLAFFFPFEIQILDYENYLKTRVGESSHAEYKKRQVHAARRRVLQGLL
jgi:uncharacterized protein (TIGR04562 family)